MTDRRTELFQAVLDDPDTDEPRLAFAEWLDAQGDPQGEFIRLEIAAAHEARRYGRHGRYLELNQSARELRTKYGSAWTGTIETYGTGPFFSRGFVECLAMDAAVFLQSAPDAFRAAPLRQITMTNAGGLLRELSQSPHLERLAYLGMQQNQLGDAGVAVLVQSPHLSRLKGLDLSFNGIDVQGVEALCASDRLPSLIFVNLAGNRAEDPAEGYGEDWMSGLIVQESIHLDEFGQRLEATYGHKAWLHAPSLLRSYPPRTEDY